MYQTKGTCLFPFLENIVSVMKLGCMGSNPLTGIAIRQKKKKKEVKKNVKKLFISQPMQGKTNEEIYKERNVAIEKASELLGEPVEVIDSLKMHP